MTAPSPKEALEQALAFIESHMHYSQPGPDAGEEPSDMFTHEAVPVAVGIRSVLATLQPSGERRETIARIICYWDKTGTCHDNYCGGSCRAKTPNTEFFKAADEILASGLVQDEAGWRDISSAPKDGTPFIGAFWSIRWADSHRKGDVVTCWWQPEFDAFISSCREMSLAPGLTFENGETRQLHSPVIEPVTHWKPLDRPAIRSARNGGAES